MASRTGTDVPFSTSDDLTGRKLDDNMLGLVEALIIIPKVDKPYLPTRHPEEKGLYYPTGPLFGVYFIEELKYAVTQGYTVVACTSGYLFEPMDSPFDSYVIDLYARRLKAKGAGLKVYSYILKNLLNSLYGRLAIAPESNITELLTFEQSRKYLDSGGPMESLEEIGDVFMLHYIRNVYENSGPWQPPVNTSPQMSAAIMAYGRMSQHRCHHRRHGRCL